jgi:MraZ protein
MQTYSGEFNHQLDAKNRIHIPAKFRNIMGDSYYFAKGTDRCVYVLPEQAYNEVAENLDKYNIFDADKVKGRREFFKSVYSMEEDAQGRVVFPSKLKEYAYIEKDIVILGVGKYIEIWAKEVYDKYFSDEEYDAQVYKLKYND